MKRMFQTLVVVCLLFVSAVAQNWTTVSASNITDLNQNKLAAGQLCFLGTDQNDNPISFNIGGGGQSLRRAYCASVTNGVAGSFTVPNPQFTAPSGIYYRVTAKDSSTGQEVLRYTQVTFTGGTFNFDNYAPANLGTFAPLSGNSVVGNLSVSGNITATGSVFGANIPNTFITTIANAGSALTQRSTLNFFGGITCADNSGNSRTDCQLGTHNLLSSSHGDTTAASAVRGDGIFAIGSTPTWQRLAHSSTAGGYFKWNGTDIVASTGAAAGTGSCTNQAVTAANADAAPTCTTLTSAYVDSSILSTSGTQSPSNKTLNGANSGNSVTLIAVGGPVTAITGNNSAQAIYSLTIPANTVAVGKILHYRIALSHSSGSASVSYVLSLNGVTVESESGAGTFNMIWEGDLYAIDSTHAAHSGEVRGSLAFTRSNSSIAGLNWAAGQTLQITFNVANTDQLAGVMAKAELSQ